MMLKTIVFAAFFSIILSTSVIAEKKSTKNDGIYRARSKFMNFVAKNVPGLLRVKRILDGWNDDKPVESLRDAMKQFRDDPTLDPELKELAGQRFKDMMEKDFRELEERLKVLHN